jgi:pimeloyl-ACP methyl ester carboxylesterase
MRTFATAAGITVVEHDRTRPYLLLHGGAGAGSMAGFAELLAGRTRSRVLVPTHPGFGGTPLLAGTVRDLARAYVDLLDELGLTGVTVVGNSFGGWLAAEIALLGSPRVRAAVLLDAIGAEVPGHPAADVGPLTPADIVALAWHDPGRAPVGGPRPDLAALAAYGGPTLSDPTLLDRLGRLDLPVHVIWGASDRIVDTAHGTALAAAIPAATLTVLPDTGHLPQLESPEPLLAALLAGDPEVSPGRPR